MDTLFVVDESPGTDLFTADAGTALEARDDAALLLARADPAATVLSADPLLVLLADEGPAEGGGGGASCPACLESFKVLFTNAGNVVLLNDGRIAVGRY